MAKKKQVIENTQVVEENISDENINEKATEGIKDEQVNETVTPEIVSPTYKFNKGDMVKVSGCGNKKYDGSGVDVIQNNNLRWIGNIIQGANFPYELIDHFGSVIGYFKEEDMKKVN